MGAAGYIDEEAHTTKVCRVTWGYECEYIAFHDMGLVCRGENPPCNHCPHDMLALCPRHGVCRGGTSWTHFVLLMRLRKMYNLGILNLSFTPIDEKDELHLALASKRSLVCSL